MSDRYSLKGWKLKEFLKGNKEIVKAAVALSILFFAGLGPVGNIVGAGVAKIILDVVDYYVSE